eukprot:CFRG2317T1
MLLYSFITSLWATTYYLALWSFTEIPIRHAVVSYVSLSATDHNQALGTSTGLSWTEMFSKIKDTDTDAATIRQLLYPLTTATKVSYTGDTSEILTGFHLIASLTPRIGLHAFAYASISDSNKVLVAFRGTTSESDTCADAVIWDYPQPAMCAKFNNSTLDYISQARAFVNRTLETHFDGSTDNVDLMFTGHSLGCGMTGLMTLSFAPTLNLVRGVCFAPPGIKSVAHRLGLESQRADQVLGLAIPWDPIVRSTETLQVGTLCTFEDVREPLPCRKCKNYLAQKDSPSCQRCYRKTHIYGHYLDSLRDMRTRPHCTVMEGDTILAIDE